MAAEGGDLFFFGGVVIQKSFMLNEVPYLNAQGKSTDWTQEVLKTNPKQQRQKKGSRKCVEGVGRVD